MLNLILDLAIIVIIALCVWRGISKGIILSVVGLLALVLAFYCARYAADTYSDKFVDAMKPFVGSMVDEATTAEVVDKNSQKEPDENAVYDVAVSVLMKMGLSQGAAETKAEECTRGITELGDELKSAITHSYMETVAYVFTFIIAFLLINVIFSVLLNLANIVFKLPGLHLLNLIGGGVAGLIYGFLMVFAIAWMLRFTGFIISKEVVQRTLLLKWLMGNNPMFSLMGF